jgi:hypothetical protein
MPFPYLAPLKDWIVDVLEDREKNPSDTNLKMPWAIMASGALVVKADAKDDTAEKKTQKFKNLIDGTTPASNEYYGCIIRNEIDRELNYQIKETIAGTDFFGTPIKVEGESNRRVSTPIIESIDIDTDGANNTLKTATVNVRCFTLKQFEMFELFFCKPGMNVLLEYGDSTLDRKKYSTNKSKNPEAQDAFTSTSQVKDQLINKTDYNTFVDKFSEFYRFNSTSLKSFQKHIEKSRGTYDMVAGKVTDYSFSIDADGTYPVRLEISQGNQMSLAIPINIGNSESKIKTNDKNKPDEFTQWKDLLTSDLNLNTLDITKDNWQNEFFNWGKVNESKKDETSSLESYISLRFILKVLMNYSLNNSKGYDEDTFKFAIPKYKVGGSEEEFIPIKIHKNLISSSEDVIFPNKQLVKFSAPVKGSKENNVVLISDKRETATINGYSVEESKKVTMFKSDGTGEIEINPLVDKSDLRNGNALNIFIKYKSVVQIWRASYTRLDFLDGVLKLLNTNSYGLFRLVRGSVVEVSTASILDIKSINDLKEPTNTIYRFKPTTIHSIVRDFSFNFEMSNLVAGRTIFNSQRFLVESLKKLPVPDPKKPTDPNVKIPLPEDAYKNFDNSLFSNADGYYSINKIDLKALEKNWEEAVKKRTATEPEKEEPNEAKNITELIEEKSIKFKFDKATSKTLIYTDGEFIKKSISTSVEEQKSSLTPIDITITIDGMSGFNCGEYFKIDGIPEIYNQIGVFQITNTKHTVAADGWKTTLEAGFRINK